ncbi:tRNA pseudouridine(55) synthase TruB [Chamaesiphon polymorphus]|uniref:tRNA pseudouridine synthase B n=1 Tax=Chamaesiphon polymorphus CCALA 037 TaxID=2107692 RepID=A0A2T1GKW8_9CYAN|nr:tRNA pseudouridine(55) synthase TruB [Chamaesiphon polymorphus]PSB58495.1 tRNA pseudouridine(55) synthase TruB [Chamaesiphon polymorphus CCALA 037]
MDGFINLKKLPDWTSHDCVAKVRRILQTKKVGHGGTLDPAAVGVLPIAIGKATRLLQYLPEGKAYRAIIRLGIETTTDDLAGEIIYSEPASAVTIDRIQAVIPEFIGEIVQTPPMYSAIQVNGQRLYKLARAGEVIEVPTRLVNIYTIDILNWTPGDFPEIEVQINCGGGTYIRSIARDLGVKLGTRGVLAFLERNASCGFELPQSITLEDLETQQRAGTFIPIAPERGLAHLPTVTLLAADLVKFWSQGKRLPLCELQLTPTNPDPSGFVKVMDEHCCLGVGEIRQIESEHLLVPQTVLI